MRSTNTCSDHRLMRSVSEDAHEDLRRALASGRSKHAPVVDALFQVQGRRDAAVEDWFIRIRAVEGAVQLLDLAQGGLSRPEIAVRLGDRAGVEFGVREILRSLVELAVDGEFAVRLAAHAIQTCLAALPAFADLTKRGPRPSAAELLLERLARSEDDT